MQTTPRPLQPPSPRHLPPNLTSLVTSAPDLLKKKNNPWITSRPQRGPCQASAFIGVQMGFGEGGVDENWQLFEGVEGERV